MAHERVWIGLLILILLTTLPASALAAPEPSPVGQTGGELLQNPGFEGVTCAAGSAPGWCNDNWTRDTFNGGVYQEIFTPQKWITFWSEGVNPNDGVKYGRPECKVIPKVTPFAGPPARIRSGNYAIMQFGFYRSIDSGVYQVVTGLSPGAVVQLSAYAHSWTCDDDNATATSCGDPYQMTFMVGIDPNGGTNPWAGSIVWASGFSQDQFRLIGPVQATVGPEGKVTVFLRATGKWRYKHNDVYWDDASLVYVTAPTPPTNTPPPPPPTNTPGPPPTPRNTPTPRPDGAIVHIVESGDTLYGIALQYNVDVNQLRQLNAGSLGANDLIQVGQAIVISIPSVTPTFTPLPPPTAAPEVVETPAQGGEGGVPAAGGATICALAYHDRNGDTMRNDVSTEELLPNAELSIAGPAGVVARHITDGVSEPHCFTGLTPGAYRVILRPPPGYAPSGYAEWPVAITEGASLDIQFGLARAANPTDPGAVAATATPAPSGAQEGGGSTNTAGSVGKVLSTLAKIGGAALLLLAMGTAALFFFSRRRI